MRHLYRLAFIVDDGGNQAAADTVQTSLAPAMVSARVDVALLAHLTGTPSPRPVLSRVAVATEPTEAVDPDPCAGCAGRERSATDLLLEVAETLNGPAPTLAKLAGLLRAAGVEVVTNPGRRHRR